MASWRFRGPKSSDHSLERLSCLFFNLRAAVNPRGLPCFWVRVDAPFSGSTLQAPTSLNPGGSDRQVGSRRARKDHGPFLGCVLCVRTHLVDGQDLM